MLDAVVWVVFAWVAGSMAILGCLMALGGLVLWLIPPGQLQPSQRQDREITSTRQRWLKLMGFSLAIALTGVSLLVLVPFPAHAPLPSP